MGRWNRCSKVQKIPGPTKSSWPISGVCTWCATLSRPKQWSKIALLRDVCPHYIQNQRSKSACFISVATKGSATTSTLIWIALVRISWYDRHPYGLWGVYYCTWVLKMTSRHWWIVGSISAMSSFMCLAASLPVRCLFSQEIRRILMRYLTIQNIVNCLGYYLSYKVGPSK